MRCLLVTNLFPPHIGGPATFIPLLAGELAERGHEVTVVCSSERPTDPADSSRPYHVRRVWTASPYLYQVLVRRVLILRWGNAS